MEGGRVADAEDRPVVMLLSTDPSLAQLVGDAGAAAGFEVGVGATASLGQAAAASAVLVGVDAGPAMSRVGVPRPSAALVVGRDDCVRDVWDVAGDLGAAGAVCLPSGAEWLVRWLHRMAGPAQPSDCAVAALFSAAGGVGGSTLSAALGLTAARRGMDPLLVDGQAGPAGVEMLLGDPVVDNQWTRFADIRGYLHPDALLSLPVLESVRCLGWGGRPEATNWLAAVPSLLSAAQRDHRIVVVDAGMNAAVCDVLPRSARTCLIVPASWRGVIAAGPRLDHLTTAFDEPPVVILRDVGGPDDPRSFAQEFAGSPYLVAEFDPRVIEDEARCRPQGDRRRSAVSRTASRLLERLVAVRTAA